MATQITRRGFIAGAAVAGAGLAGASTIVSAIADEAPVAGTYDLVVVGAGGTGLAAAARAAQQGASVLVLEAEGAAGGTTRFSGGHIKFMNSTFVSQMPARTEESDAELQAFLELDPSEYENYAADVAAAQEQIRAYLLTESPLWFDSIEYWLARHAYYTQGVDLDGVKASSDREVVATAYRNADRIHDWLVVNGLTFSAPQENNVGEGGPLSVEPEGKGAGLVEALLGMCEAAGVEIAYKTKAVRLTSEDGRVTGVVAEGPDGEVAYGATGAVLLSCGGFASNTAMVVECDNVNPVIWPEFGSFEPASNDGTGIAMATELGAATTNMGWIQYMAMTAGGMMPREQVIPLCMRAAKMAVNKDGVRFMNDARRWGYSTTGLGLDQPEGLYYLVGDGVGLEQMADMAQGFVDNGYAFIGQTLEEAAELAGIDPAAFVETIDAYNGYCAAGEDPDFGRALKEDDAIGEGPYLVIVMSSYAQNTMGGLVINTAGQVVDEAGAPIEGLYAAGEVIGNVDGSFRRHGDNFAQALYYAWCAADAAVAK